MLGIFTYLNLLFFSLFLSQDLNNAFVLFTFGYEKAKK